MFGAELGCGPSEPSVQVCRQQGSGELRSSDTGSDLVRPCVKSASFSTAEILEV